MSNGQARSKDWITKRRTLSFADGPKLMAILNVTPDSFSDGGRFAALDAALRQVEKMIEDGADIIDIGGESTRPGSEHISPEVELSRVVPIIEAVAGRFDIAISVDTSKSAVAEQALEKGADIINDISGFRFDRDMAGIAAKCEAGVVLMHLKGSFETMHVTDPDTDIVEEVSNGLQWSIEKARSSGVSEDRICIDVGIGFGKTQEQNLRLLRCLPEIGSRFPVFPMLVGLSRKSFIGRIIGESDPEKRLAGTIAANCVALMAGADILRVHDVKPAAEALKVVSAVLN